MSKGEQKNSRESKKPKQAGGKSAPKSAYQLQKQTEIVASPYKNKKK